MIFDLLETMPYTTNCYLIGDEAEKVCALVDPGACHGGAQRPQIRKNIPYPRPL